jgi:alpha-tubulin suppressor-like RCC1 family protein
MGMIATGSRHTCGLRLDGTVVCWGTGEDFATGSVPNGADRSTPQPIPELAGVIVLDAGSSHTCALLGNGNVLCWGQNLDSQLGNGTQTGAEAVPVRVSGVNDAVGVTAGTENSCAVLADGTATCWGENRDGQLADGTTIDRRVPVPVDGLRNAVAISAGQDHTCALRSDGTVRCWGANDQGQLGDGTTEQRVGPVAVEGIEDAVAMSVGGSHACALTGEGVVFCWGSNHFGQVGSGQVSESDPIEEAPLRVEGVAGAVALSAGDGHTCAILDDGRVVCWGYDNAGQLGFGGEFPVDDADRAHPSPLEVVGLRNATAISASPYAHTCALLTDGTAMCWGINDYGELGDGGEVGQTESRVPVAVVEFDIALPGP